MPHGGTSLQEHDRHAVGAPQVQTEPDGLARRARPCRGTVVVHGADGELLPLRGVLEDLRERHVAALLAAAHADEPCAGVLADDGCDGDVDVDATQHRQLERVDGEGPGVAAQVLGDDGHQRRRPRGALRVRAVRGLGEDPEVLQEGPQAGGGDDVVHVRSLVGPPTVGPGQARLGV